jgi:adenine-specific DNA methylase
MSDRRDPSQDVRAAGPGPRLIEAAFPLRQASLDSVHEKNVRHGHISTLHIWPARRPLAACRAVLLATLLPDPGDAEGRRRLMTRIGGEVLRRQTRAGKLREETAGGVLHWGRESDPELEKLRDEIREAFDGRAPQVLDPFAGGGAIPLEAMRLGCEVTASDLNPVAWFVLRCTLHYPRLVAGQELPLPAFAVRDRDFVEACLKAQGVTRKAALREELRRLGHGDGDPVQVRSALLDSATGSHASTRAESAGPTLEAGFPWHLRAWGRRVLAEARRDLAKRYPTYADFEPVRRKGRRKRDAEIRFPEQPFKPRPPRLLEPDADGNVSVAELNAEFDSGYLENEANPRWVSKPTVAYLWARTVRCANCRAEMPLLKTRWLCKKPDKRVLLSMTLRHDGSGVDFGIEHDVRAGEGNAAQRREHDRRLGAGTMSRSGAACPCCGGISTMADLRNEGRAGRLDERMTAVVVDGQKGKEYRLPTELELAAALVDEKELRALFAEIPFGLPEEPTAHEKALGMRVPRYGFDAWRKLFTNRQLLALGAFVRAIRGFSGGASAYPEGWHEALTMCLAPSISRLTDRCSSLATWTNDHDKIRSTFARFALPMVWDFAESCPLADTTGGFVQAVEWVGRVCEHLQQATGKAPLAALSQRSATRSWESQRFDVICTDPPYYDAIPYSDLMDFFYVWLRRVVHGFSPEMEAAFAAPLGPKWSPEASGGKGDGELIDDASRFGGDRDASKRNYEDGMARAFRRFHDALRDDGRLVIVFANKQPDAWETLVSALIRAGFVVCGSWPIQTEMKNRQRSLASAALSSSIWLACRRRPADAKPGWDAAVLTEMRANITESLRRFWDAGIRGPDFVWAATGPALEAFSRHPVVKKADAPRETLSVAEFLRQVRRIVVTFVVNRLLEAEPGAPTELDDLTTYYLLHRSDFGLDAAPAGVCILYAVSCNLSDADLAGGLDLLARGAPAAAGEASVEDGDGGGPAPATSGSEARLKPWNRRRSRGLGEPSADGEPPALIDCVHRLMQLWKTGEQGRVDRYLADRGLWRHELFARVVQAVIELAAESSEERSILESIQNHLQSQGAQAAAPRQRTML